MRRISLHIFILNTMISIISKAAAVVCVACLGASSAIAAPYVNVENNSGFTDNDFLGGATDLHVGYEHEIGDSAVIYLQGGPRFNHIVDEDTEREYSAKVGGAVDITDHLGVYGEVLAVTNDREFSTDSILLGTKAGVTYAF